MMNHVILILIVVRISIIVCHKSAQFCVQNIEESSNAAPSLNVNQWVFSAVSLGCDDAREEGMQGEEGGLEEEKGREGGMASGETKVKK